MVNGHLMRVEKVLQLSNESVHRKHDLGEKQVHMEILLDLENENDVKVSAWEVLYHIVGKVGG